MVCINTVSPENIDTVFAAFGGDIFEGGAIPEFRCVLCTTPCTSGNSADRIGGFRFTEYLELVRTMLTGWLLGGTRNAFFLKGQLKF
jgi:hypothetical protein